MQTQLVPDDLLQKPGKVLFISHLALGDFTYMQNGFRAFAEAYPHIKIHLWVDEVRRTADASKWGHLKKYALYDWAQACPFFEKVYCRTYSPALFQESITEAQQENYPLVISLVTLRGHEYARLARNISPQGFAAGTKTSIGIKLHRYLAYRQLNGAIPAHPEAGQAMRHISDVYAGWFHQLFGMRIPSDERFPFVQIPERWVEYAKQTLASWDFKQGGGKLVFVNPYAKTGKRCWPLERVAELIQAMSARSEWDNASFIINAVPEEMDRAKEVFDRYALARTRLFTADENFFQLPAILSQCDLIISVETAVMHLANAVRVPVIALMRQKNPEWAPIDSANSTVITTKQRSDWVKSITVEQVMKNIQV
jgi:heptosyltransferase-3